MKITGNFLILAGISLLAASANARPAKVYDLTCGIQLGAQPLQAVKTVRVASQPVTISEGSAFGTYVVSARRHHVYATVTEKPGGLSNQFIGEIELHNGPELEHGIPHEHEINGFSISVTPAGVGAEKVTLSCQGKKVPSDRDGDHLPQELSAEDFE